MKRYRLKKISSGKNVKKYIPNGLVEIYLKDISENTIVKNMMINNKILNLSKLSFSFDFNINKQLIKASKGR